MLETPDRIVENKSIAHGVFRLPIRDMNFADAGPQGGRLNRLLWRWRLKEWLGFGIEHPDLVFTVFFQDAKYLSSSNVFVLNRRTNELIVHERAGLRGAAKVAANLYDDVSRHVAKGYYVECYSHVDAGVHIIRVEIDATRSKPGVSAEIILSEDLSRVQPLVVSFPLRRGYSIFTHKAPMPVSGRLEIGDKRIEYDPARDLALMDEHKSFLPYRTVWRWATFAGYDSKGRLVGANLGDHDTVEDQMQWNENCIWLEDKIFLLGAIDYDFDPKCYMEPWKIREVEGRAELTFFPQVDKVKNVSLGVLGMRYFQPSGYFKGFLMTDSGERIEIDNIYGVAEVMDARW